MCIRDSLLPVQQGRSTELAGPSWPPEEEHMQVGAPVAISAEVGAAHRGQRLDGGSDDDEEPPELTRQLGRQIGEVVMLAGHQHGRDRQTRALRTDPPVLVAPDDPLGGLSLGASAGGRVLTLTVGFTVQELSLIHI